MVDWQSPEVQDFCLFLYSQITVFFLGVFLWYLILTFPDVEFGLIIGRLKFKLAHIPFLLARYSQFTVLIMLAILSRSGKPYTCVDVPFVRGIAVTGNMALSAASSNLGIRALAIWRRNRYVQSVIALICISHIIFAITLGICGVQVRWDEEHVVCTVIQDTVKYGLFSYFLTTIGIDLSILTFTVVGLHVQERRSGEVSPLWSTLVTQSVAYTMLTCVTGVPMAVLTRLNLNYSMNMLFVVPGTTVSVMASSAVVSSLLKLQEPELKKSTRINKLPYSAESERKTYASSNQLSTRISLSSVDCRNSCDIEDSRFDIDVVGQSPKIGREPHVKVEETDGDSFAY